MAQPHGETPSAPAGEPSLHDAPGAHPKESLQRLLDGLRETLGVDRASVTIPRDGPEGPEEKLVLWTGAPMTFAPPISTGEPGVIQLSSDRTPEARTLINDLASASPRSPVEEAVYREGFRALARFPLVSEGHRVGSLNLISRRPGAFTPEAVARVDGTLDTLAAVLQHLVLILRHRQQSHFLAIAQELIEDMSAFARIRETCDYLTRRLTDLLDLDRCAVYLVNEDASWLTCEAVYDRGKGDPSRSRLLPSLRIESTPVLSQVLDGHPISMLDPRRHILLPERVAGRLDLEETGALLLVPLRQADRPLGMLLCQRTEPRPIMLGEERDSLRLLGQQIGLILHSRQVAESQERSTRNFAELLDMSHAVSSTADLSEVPAVVARRARDLCEADEATLFLVDDGGSLLLPVVCLGAYAEQVMKARIRMGEGITGTVAACRRGEIINHAEMDPRSVQIPDTPLEPEAILAAPLICADRLIGVLTLHKLEGRTFDPVDLNTVEIFSSQAAIAFENARLIAGIREERTRLVTMLQHMEEGVAFADKDGRVLLLNAAATRMLNLGEGDRVGTPVLDLLQGPDFAVVREALGRVRAGAERNVTQEYAIRGRTFLCSVSSVHSGKADERSGEVLLFKDVTDLKEIESQLLQSSKMSAVGQLAAGVAHEFNNLIASIYGYAQFMKEHPNPEVVGKGVEIILRSSERARELTSSLLTFSRRRPGRREPVDLNQILTDTLLLLNRQFEKSNIRVTRKIGRVPLTVADPGKIQQVFLNLLINAHQAMEAGGQLTVETGTEGSQIEIRINDTGVGIRSDHLSRIFEPFFTTKGALSGAKTPGTGLGLSTAYNIVRDHGGAIRVVSSPGQGTAFTVVLPIRTLHERVEEEPGPRPPRSLDCTGRILVVDDDPALRDLVGELLGSLGHQVQMAGDARTAEDLLESRPCDLVILSHGLAGGGSTEMYRRVRARQERFPVIFITDRSAVQTLEAEGDPWVFRLNKPFRNRDLIALVSRVLSQSLRRAG